MIATTIPRETLLHVVKSLPAAPRILAQLGHLLLDPNSEMDEVTALLRCDTALTARIIRIANSVMYNTGQPYASLEEALARVGYTEVYRLTGFAAVAQITDGDLRLYGVNGAQLRENSLLTALLMEVLARRVGVDTRAAYTAGLLRSVGKIGLDRVTRVGSPGTFRGTFDAMQHGAVMQWESQALGMTNCEAAAIILKEWRFPFATIAAIRDHYLQQPDPSLLADMLNVAAGAADRAGYAFPGEKEYWCEPPLTIGSDHFNAEDLDELVQQALRGFAQVRAAVA